MIDKECPSAPPLDVKEGAEQLFDLMAEWKVKAKTNQWLKDRFTEFLQAASTPLKEAVHKRSGGNEKQHAAWLADKIHALGDYAKEAAAMLNRWPDEKEVVSGDAITFAEAAGISNQCWMQDATGKWIVHTGLETVAMEVFIKDRADRPAIPIMHPLTAKSEAAKPVLPDGWVAVPKEPTKEMIDAGAAAQDEYHHTMYHFNALQIYNVMLTASPKQPTPERES